MLYAGEHVLISTEIKIGGALSAPDTIKVSITEDKIGGTEVLAEIDMTGSAGEYEYEWDSGANTAGTYYAKIKATNNGGTNWEYILIQLY